jgi:hypothetical protein
MRLRGYVDRTPVEATLSRTKWPAVFVTDPGEQVALLRHKYTGKEQGRIPLPRSPQELWAQHKYSVLARSPRTYAALGRTVARAGHRILLAALAKDLIWILRDAPSPGRLMNAVEHMWGHVRHHASPGDLAESRASVGHLLLCTQKLALRVREKFLLSSTALSELAVFVDS